MSEEINKQAQEAAKAEAAEEAKGQRKREIIKNIAIIFLAVMLVLTFFSNTIMNFSLPQVSTEQISSGTIKTQVRGQGVIETVDPYNLTVKETRTIKSVNVKEGDDVQIGDVIYELEGEESSELEDTRSKLRTAEIEFESAVITNGLGADQVLEIKAGGETNLTEIQNNIAKFDQNLENAKRDLNTHTAAKNKYQAELDSFGTYTADESAINSWKNKEEEASYNKKVNEKARDTYKQFEEEYVMAIQQGIQPTPEQITGHELYTKYANEVNANEMAIAEAQKNQNQLRYSQTDPNAGRRAELTKLIANENLGIQLSQKAVEDAKDAKDTYVKSMSNKLDAISKYATIESLKQKIEKLEKEAVGREITSPVAGKIITLGKKSGEQTDPQTPVAVIRVEGKGYRVNFSVDNKQAKTVKVGDVVNVENYGFPSEAKVNLVAINPDKTDPQNKKNLVFDISAVDGIEVGQTLSLSVGDASASYDLTVPNSALDKDKKGDFILILQEKQVPFGKRYIAKKVEVTKIYAKDDTRSAIEADVEGWNTYVISNSTQPIKAGQQVRLSTEVADSQ